MIGMQYTFPLPDNYDMDSLRRQIAEWSPAFDEMDGLYQKAFLISKQGIHGALENSYAPYFFWSYAAAVTNFLVSDSFKAVSEFYGRPAVMSWLPLYFSSGKAQRAKPIFATKEIIDIAPDTNLQQVRGQQYKQHRQWAEHPENQSGFIGLDANTWKIVRLALWTQPQENLPEGVEGFEVVHLSAPALDPNYFVSPC